MAGNDGFTLIEVLIALLVLSLGLLSIATLQISAIRGNNEAGKVTEASTLIEKKLDQYKTMDFASVTSEADREDIYQWQTTVQDSTPVSGLKTITVRVSWVRGDRPHALEYATIIAKD